VSEFIAPDRDLGLQGHYAGFASRLASLVVDVLAIVLLFDVAGRMVEYIVTAVSGKHFTVSEYPVAAAIALAVWAFVYCAYPLAVNGRTFGMAVAGVRVVRPDGSPLDTRHAVFRMLAFPLSFLTLGIGFLMILSNRDRRALHDRVAQTAVVYSWDARSARLRFLAKGGTE
jgi:uncharacterized RDD family membrane protein YckC